MNAESARFRMKEMREKHACRVLVLGDCRVGKSTIIHQFLKGELLLDKTKTLLSHQKIFTQKTSELTLNILEFGGNKSNVLRDHNIHSADAFVLVYSLLDENSFETVRSLRSKICSIKNSENVPVVVVANKRDTWRREVSMWRTVAEFTTCMDWEWVHTDLSATTFDKVAEVFQNVLTQAGIDFSLTKSLEPRFHSLVRRFSIRKK